ncbi:MAG: hypothetical protein ACTSXQ_05870 [Alphaproteobacteria bacterium]
MLDNKRTAQKLNEKEEALTLREEELAKKISDFEKAQELATENVKKTDDEKITAEKKELEKQVKQLTEDKDDLQTQRNNLKKREESITKRETEIGKQVAPSRQFNGKKIRGNGRNFLFFFLPKKNRPKPKNLLHRLVRFGFDIAKGIIKIALVGLLINAAWNFGGKQIFTRVMNTASTIPAVQDLRDFTNQKTHEADSLFNIQFPAGSVDSTLNEFKKNIEDGMEYITPKDSIINQNPIENDSTKIDSTGKTSDAFLKIINFDDPKGTLVFTNQSLNG